MLRFAVLGPLEVRCDGAPPVQLGGPQPRALLTALVAARGAPVAADVLIDMLWGASPPASATGTVQSYVSRLRGVLDRAGQARIEAGQSGYRLVCQAGTIDLDEFDRFCADGRRRLDEGDLRAASDDLHRALALWRGPALPELARHPASASQVVLLDEQRLATHELCVDIDLRLGRHHELVSALSALVAEHPFRESLRVKLAVALYRCGRQADALRSIAHAAEVLRDELGLEPGAEIRDVEHAILDHADWLRHDGPEVRTEPAVDPDDGFVGRDEEISQILDALGGAVDDARFVVIDGDAGIGKTRLADEVRRRALVRGSAAAWGRCDEGGAAPALWPWLEIIRPLAADGAGDPRVRDLLAGAVPLVAGQGDSLRFESFDAIADLLQAAGDAAPLVVLLDDIQWADATSLELLRFLAGRLVRGVLVVATVRTTSVGRQDDLTDTLGAIARRPGSQRHHLDGLTVEQTTTLLETAVRKPVRSADAATIHGRAEGNPFYAIQLASLIATGRRAPTEVPPTVRDAVRCRLALLPEATRQLLTGAAVIGRDFEPALLAATEQLRLDECADGLNPALAERILIESPDQPGTLRFSHALVREVLLDGLTALNRARLHVAVADAMEARGEHVDDAEVLAEHLWRAVTLTGPERAAEALERAAEVALHRVAYDTAEGLLERATRLRGRAAGTTTAREAELSTIVRFLEVTQATRYFCGADLTLLERARTLASELGHDDLARELLWFQWSSLATAADVANGTHLIDELHTSCRRDGRPNVRAIGEASRGVAWWAIGELDRARGQFDLALDLLNEASEPVDAFDAESRLAAQAFQLWLKAIMGPFPPDDVYAEFDAFIDRMPSSACPAICGFAGTTSAMLMQFDRLEHFVRRARSADPSAQFAFWGGQLLMYEAMLCAERGEVDEAERRFTEGRARYMSVGARSCLPVLEAVLGELLSRHDRLDVAAELIRSARVRLAATNEEWTRPVVALAEGALAVRRGQPMAAAEYLEEARRAVAEQRAVAFEPRLKALARAIGLVTAR